jgi:hypothetical protein
VRVLVVVVWMRRDVAGHIGQNAAGVLELDRGVMNLELTKHVVETL